MGGPVDQAQEQAPQQTIAATPFEGIPAASHGEPVVNGWDFAHQILDRIAGETFTGVHVLLIVGALCAGAIFQLIRMWLHRGSR